MSPSINNSHLARSPSLPQNERRIRNTQPTGSLTNSLHPTTRRLLLLLNAHTSFFATSSSSAVCNASSSIRTCARSLMNRCSAAFAGAGIISSTLRSSVSASPSAAFEVSSSKLVQAIDSVENVTSKPRWVRSTLVGTLKILWMLSKKTGPIRAGSLAVCVLPGKALTLTLRRMLWACLLLCRWSVYWAPGSTRWIGGR